MIKTPDLGALPIDLPRLIESRMLLVAASGQGRSFALRRLIDYPRPGYCVALPLLFPAGEPK